MKSDTPRTDAAVLDEHAVAETCRRLERELNSVTNQWASDVGGLERELATANRKLEWLRSIAVRTYPMWGYNTASWKIQFSRKLDDSVKDTLSKDFFTAIEQCMRDGP